MAKRSPAKQPVTYYGKRAGSKRSDFRWESPDGELWDSRYEYLVYVAFRQAGKAIRRCTKSDTMAFTLPIRSATCRACGSTEVGQRRTYTPDFHVASEDPQHPALGYYIEAKGYLRAKERALLRSFYKANPDAGVRFLLQRDFPATKRSSITTWFGKFLPKSQVAVWSGAVPEGW